MKQIVLQSSPIETIVIDDVFGTCSPQKIIVQVYENHATVLTKVETPENKDGETDSFGFVNIGRGLPKTGNRNTSNEGDEIYSDINSRTGGKSSVEAYNNIKNRIRGFIDEGNCKYYVFDSLPDFAKAIIENNWR